MVIKQKQDKTKKVGETRILTDFPELKCWLSFQFGCQYHDHIICFPDILILGGQNNENITREKIVQIQIKI